MNKITLKTKRYFNEKHMALPQGDGHVTRDRTSEINSLIDNKRSSLQIHIEITRTANKILMKEESMYLEYNIY